MEIQLLHRRNFVKIGLALSGLATLAQAENAQANNAVVVNRSARLRALSQRLVKFRAQQLLAIAPETSLDSVLAVEKLIKSHMLFLNSSVPTQARPLLSNLQATITTMFGASNTAITKDSLIQVNTAAAEVLKNADALTVEMVAISKQKAINLVNIAGRQRMLSQRMTKNYFLIANGIQTKELPANIDADRKLFTDSLAALGASPEADAKIAKGLADVAVLYKRFEPLVVDRTDAGLAKANLVNLATLSEQLLTAAHDATLLFEDAFTAKA